MTPLVTVHGTWGLTHHSFWRPESLFQQRAVARGFAVLDDPFMWSGDLAVKDEGPWQVAAHALIWYCASKGLEAPAVISHSHGAQVVAYAAAWGQRFTSLVDIEGPVRSDLFPIYQVAASKIGRWLHTWNNGDAVILSGELGAPGEVTPLMPYAENLEIAAKYDHSGLFDDLAAWDALGLWDRLRVAPPDRLI